MERKMTHIFTDVEVAATSDQLIAKFSDTCKISKGRLSYNDETLWEGTVGVLFPVDIMESLADRVPGVRFDRWEEEKPREYSIEVAPDVIADIIADDSTSTILRVTTYMNDPDLHYRRVEELKRALAEAGFSLMKSKCVVHFDQEC